MESHLNEFLEAYDNHISKTLDDIGIFITAEAQLRAPVGTAKSDKHKGNLRRSITFEKNIDEAKVDIGATNQAEYGLYVEKGTKKMEAEPYLEPSVMDNIARLEEIAGQSLTIDMDV